jgi:hypothetical protein
MFLPDGVVGDHPGELDGCTDYVSKIDGGKQIEKKSKETP